MGINYESAYRDAVVRLALVSEAVENRNADPEITLQIVKGYHAFIKRVATGDVGNGQAFDAVEWLASVRREAQLVLDGEA